jgi:hypothetical protein
MRQFLGLDTETAKGKAIIIASQEGYQRVDTFLDCVRFLLRPGIGIGFFYNLDYDFRAIIKHLGSKVAEQLYLHKKLDVDIDGTVVKIEYIPAKFCRFAIDKHGISCYDLWQYYGMSLDDAGKKYVGDSKVEVSQDKLTHLEDFIDDNATMQEFGSYCHHDAEVCYKLAHFLLTSFESCGITTTKYFSTGYIAKHVLKKHHKCFLLPNYVERFCQAAFHGGRIEVIRKGSIPHLYVYDINSAYPAVISQLNDTCHADYKMSDTISSPVYFVQGKLWLKAGQPFYPIAFRNRAKDLTIYPHMQGVDTCISSVEHQCLIKHDLIERFDIEAVLNVHYADDTKPFAFVSDYYKKRQEGDMQKLVYKLILNSLYGIFCERIKGFRHISDSEKYRVYKSDVNSVMVAQVIEEFGAHNDYYFCDCQACTEAKIAMRLMRLRVKPVRGTVQTQDGTFVRGNKRGRFSNMLNACLITASVRCQVFDFAMRSPDHVLMFATDSVTLDSPIDIPESKALGDISLQRHGVNGLIIGSGVYEFTDTATGARYTRFRGFDSNICLRDKLTQFSEARHLDIPATQVVSLGTMVKSQTMIDHFMLNEFIDITKVLDINFDRKRSWLDDFKTCSEVLSREVSSIPLTLRGRGV